MYCIMLPACFLRNHNYKSTTSIPITAHVCARPCSCKSYTIVCIGVKFHSFPFATEEARVIVIALCISVAREDYVHCSRTVYILYRSKGKLFGSGSDPISVLA